MSDTYFYRHMYIGLNGQIMLEIVLPHSFTKWTTPNMVSDLWQTNF